MKNIENLGLSWSEPREINTRVGIRYIATAEPTREFWSAWKSDKEGIKAAGISVNKPGGNWEVTRWSETPLISLEDEGRPGELAQSATPAGVVQWSAEQQAIFGWFATGTGALVVQARAGTGKTTTIKHAFTVAPEATMLYAVFNKKNQKEAAEKITDNRVDVRTLHSLGFMFIKSVWSNAQPDDFIEMDRITAVSPSIPEEPASAVEKLVGFAKNLFITVPSVGELEALAADRNIFSGQEAEADGGWTVNRLATVAQAVMSISLVRDPAGRVSFNDMVWLPVAANWVKPRYDLVTVDEAQDMNAPQLEMAVRAVKTGGRVCIVGDDRQAIYGFRGAASDGMGLMQTRLNAATLGLTTTYRCPSKVVAIANEIVPDYVAAPTAPEGIVDDIEGHALVQSATVGDAILSRLNAPLMTTCLALLRAGTPARIEGRDVGKQLVNMVRKFKAKSVPDFMRKLETWGDKQKARTTGKNKAAKCQLIDDQVATLAAVAEESSSVADIVSRILSLFEDSDKATRPSVVLSSVHKAKGLEWNRVFVLASTFKKTSDEERNIYYVAITRTKKHLTFVG